MNTLRAAFVPGLIAGVISIFGSWLLMGVIFHRQQRATPDTWRPEGPRSYTASMVIHLFAAIAVACLYVLMVRFHVGSFFLGTAGGAKFGFCLWLATALPILVQQAVFVRFHPLVVVGELCDWLITMLAATLTTAWWLAR